MARLLVVEDEREIRWIVVELLQDAGYEVIAAASGHDASILLHTMPGFDALVTDIHMPGRLDGLALARLFREQCPETPIVYVTGNPGALRDVRTRKHKDAVILKPYRIAALIGALQLLITAEGQTGGSAAGQGDLIAA